MNRSMARLFHRSIRVYDSMKIIILDSICAPHYGSFTNDGGATRYKNANERR